MSFWKKVSGPVLLLGLASPAIVNCGQLQAMGLPATDCPAMKDGNFASLEFKGAAAEATAKFKGFLEAVYSLDKLAVEVEGDLMASCAELGKAVGMGEGELKAEKGGGEGAKKVCEAVGAKVAGMIKASGSAKLSLDIGAPRCEADVDALTKCFGECGAKIEPGELKAACEGGELSGKCEGDCKGGCTLEAGAKCSGKCEGNCKGKCDGKATKGDAGASCAGKCEGECSASCKVDAGGKCEGSCSGECSVAMKAPKCSGEFKPPKVSADCQLNCSAKTAASFKCHPPTVKVKVDGKASEDITKLVGALETSLPKIVNIQVGLGEKLVGTVKGLVEAGAELPAAAKGMGTAAIQAGICAGLAVEMAASASASINVSVKASANVSASAGGG